MSNDAAENSRPVRREGESTKAYLNRVKKWEKARKKAQEEKAKKEASDSNSDDVLHDLIDTDEFAYKSAQILSPEQTTDPTSILSAVVSDLPDLTAQGPVLKMQVEDEQVFNAELGGAEPESFEPSMPLADPQLVIKPSTVMPKRADFMKRLDYVLRGAAEVGEGIWNENVVRDTIRDYIPNLIKEYAGESRFFDVDPTDQNFEASTHRMLYESGFTKGFYLLSKRTEREKLNSQRDIRVYYNEHGHAVVQQGSTYYSLPNEALFDENGHLIGAKTGVEHVISRLGQITSNEGVAAQLSEMGAILLGKSKEAGLKSVTQGWTVLQKDERGQRVRVTNPAELARAASLITPEAVSQINKKATGVVPSYPSNQILRTFSSDAISLMSKGKRRKIAEGVNAMTAGAYRFDRVKGEDGKARTLAKKLDKLRVAMRFTSLAIGEGMGFIDRSIRAGKEETIIDRSISADDRARLEELRARGGVLGIKESKWVANVLGKPDQWAKGRLSVDNLVFSDPTDTGHSLVTANLTRYSPSQSYKNLGTKTSLARRRLNVGTTDIFNREGQITGRISGGYRAPQAISKQLLGKLMARYSQKHKASQYDMEISIPDEKDMYATGYNLFMGATAEMTDAERAGLIAEKMNIFASERGTDEKRFKIFADVIEKMARRAYSERPDGFNLSPEEKAYFGDTPLPEGAGEEEFVKQALAHRWEKFDLLDETKTLNVMGQAFGSALGQYEMFQTAKPIIESARVYSDTAIDNLLRGDIIKSIRSANPEISEEEFHKLVTDVLADQEIRKTYVEAMEGKRTELYGFKNFGSVHKFAENEEWLPFIEDKKRREAIGNLSRITFLSKRSPQSPRPDDFETSYTESISLADVEKGLFYFVRNKDKFEVSALSSDDSSPDDLFNAREAFISYQSNEGVWISDIMTEGYFMPELRSEGSGSLVRTLTFEEITAMRTAHPELFKLYQEAATQGSPAILDTDAKELTRSLRAMIPSFKDQYSDQIADFDRNAFINAASTVQSGNIADMLEAYEQAISKEDREKMIRVGNLILPSAGSLARAIQEDLDSGNELSSYGKTAGELLSEFAGIQQINPTLVARYIAQATKFSQERGVAEKSMNWTVHSVNSTMRASPIVEDNEILMTTSHVMRMSGMSLAQTLATTGATSENIEAAYKTRKEFKKLVDRYYSKDQSENPLSPEAAFGKLMEDFTAAKAEFEQSGASPLVAFATRYPEINRAASRQPFQVRLYEMLSKEQANTIGIIDERDTVLGVNAGAQQMGDFDMDRFNILLSKLVFNDGTLHSVDGKPMGGREMLAAWASVIGSEVGKSYERATQTKRWAGPSLKTEQELADEVSEEEKSRGEVGLTHNTFVRRLGTLQEVMAMEYSDEVAGQAIRESVGLLGNYAVQGAVDLGGVATPIKKIRSMLSSVTPARKGFANTPYKIAKVNESGDLLRRPNGVPEYSGATPLQILASQSFSLFSEAVKAYPDMLMDAKVQIARQLLSLESIEKMYRDANDGAPIPEGLSPSRRLEFLKKSTDETLIRNRMAKIVELNKAYHEKGEGRIDQSLARAAMQLIAQGAEGFDNTSNIIEAIKVQNQNAELPAHIAHIREAAKAQLKVIEQALDVTTNPDSTDESYGAAIRQVPLASQSVVSIAMAKNLANPGSRLDKKLQEQNLLIQKVFNKEYFDYDVAAELMSAFTGTSSGSYNINELYGEFFGQEGDETSPASIRHTLVSMFNNMGVKPKSLVSAVEALAKPVSPSQLHKFEALQNNQLEAYQLAAIRASLVLEGGDEYISQNQEAVEIFNKALAESNQFTDEELETFKLTYRYAGQETFTGNFSTSQKIEDIKSQTLASIQEAQSRGQRKLPLESPIVLGYLFEEATDKVLDTGDRDASFLKRPETRFVRGTSDIGSGAIDFIYREGQEGERFIVDTKAVRNSRRLLFGDGDNFKASQLRGYVLQQSAYAKLAAMDPENFPGKTSTEWFGLLVGDTSDETISVDQMLLPSRLRKNVGDFQIFRTEGETESEFAARTQKAEDFFATQRGDYYAEVYKVDKPSGEQIAREIFRKNVGFQQEMQAKGKLQKPESAIVFMPTSMDSLGSLTKRYMSSLARVAIESQGMIQHQHKSIEDQMLSQPEPNHLSALPALAAPEMPMLGAMSAQFEQEFFSKMDQLTEKIASGFSGDRAGNAKHIFFGSGTKKLSLNQARIYRNVIDALPNIGEYLEAGTFSDEALLKINDRLSEAAQIRDNLLQAAKISAHSPMRNLLSQLIGGSGGFEIYEDGSIRSTFDSRSGELESASEKANNQINERLKQQVELYNQLKTAHGDILKIQGQQVKLTEEEADGVRQLVEAHDRIATLKKSKTAIGIEIDISDEENEGIIKTAKLLLKSSPVGLQEMAQAASGAFESASANFGVAIFEKEETIQNLRAAYRKAQSPEGRKQIEEQLREIYMSDGKIDDVIGFLGQLSEDNIRYLDPKENDLEIKRKAAARNIFRSGQADEAYSRGRIENGILYVSSAEDKKRAEKALQALSLLESGYPTAEHVALDKAIVKEFTSRGEFTAVAVDQGAANRYRAADVAALTDVSAMVSALLPAIDKSELEFSEESIKNMRAAGVTRGEAFKAFDRYQKAFRSLEKLDINQVKAHFGEIDSKGIVALTAEQKNIMAALGISSSEEFSAHKERNMAITSGIAFESARQLITDEERKELDQIKPMDTLEQIAMNVQLREISSETFVKQLQAATETLKNFNGEGGKSTKVMQELADSALQAQKVHTSLKAQYEAVSQRLEVDRDRLEKSGELKDFELFKAAYGDKDGNYRYQSVLDAAKAFNEQRLTTGEMAIDFDEKQYGKFERAAITHTGYRRRRAIEAITEEDIDNMTTGGKLGSLLKTLAKSSAFGKYIAADVLAVQETFTNPSRLASLQFKANLINNMLLQPIVHASESYRAIELENSRALLRTGVMSSDDFFASTETNLMKRNAARSMSYHAFGSAASRAWSWATDSGITNQGGSLLGAAAAIGAPSYAAYAGAGLVGLGSLALPIGAAVAALSTLSFATSSASDSKDMADWYSGKRTTIFDNIGGVLGSNIGRGINILTGNTKALRKQYAIENAAGIIKNRNIMGRMIEEETNVQDLREMIAASPVTSEQASDILFEILFQYRDDAKTRLADLGLDTEAQNQAINSYLSINPNVAQFSDTLVRNLATFSVSGINVANIAQSVSAAINRPMLTNQVQQETNTAMEYIVNAHRGNVNLNYQNFLAASDILRSYTARLSSLNIRPAPEDLSIESFTDQFLDKDGVFDSLAAGSQVAADIIQAESRARYGGKSTSRADIGSRVYSDIASALLRDDAEAVQRLTSLQIAYNESSDFSQISRDLGGEQLERRITSAQMNLVGRYKVDNKEEQNAAVSFALSNLYMRQLALNSYDISDQIAFEKLVSERAALNIGYKQAGYDFEDQASKATNIMVRRLGILPSDIKSIGALQVEYQKEAFEKQERGVTPAEEAFKTLIGDAMPIESGIQAMSAIGAEDKDAIFKIFNQAILEKFGPSGSGMTTDDLSQAVEKFKGFSDLIVTLGKVLPKFTPEDASKLAQEVAGATISQSRRILSRFGNMALATETFRDAGLLAEDEPLYGSEEFQLKMRRDMSDAQYERVTRQYSQASTQALSFMARGMDRKQAAAFASRMGQMSAVEFEQTQGILAGDPMFMSANLNQTRLLLAQMGHSPIMMPMAPMNLVTGQQVTFQNMSLSQAAAFKSGVGPFIAAKEGYYDNVSLSDLQKGTFGIQSEIMRLNRAYQTYSSDMSIYMSNTQMAMMTGGATGVTNGGWATPGDGLEEWASLRRKMGFATNVGNGMGIWQIQDAQRRLSREQQDFSIGQQEIQLNTSGADLELKKRQFYERYDLNQRQFEYNTNFARENMAIGRFQSLTQRSWQRDDIATQQARSQLEFGFQMEDFDRNIRYARGKERVDLMREKGRAALRFSMDQAQRDKEKDRFETLAQWEDERFKREKDHFEQTIAFQKEQMEMQKRHFEEGLKQDNVRFKMQREAFEKEKQWMQQRRVLEDQQILLERQNAIWQHKMQIEQTTVMSRLQVRLNALQTAAQGLDIDFNAWMTRVRANLQGWGSQANNFAGAIQAAQNLMAGLRDRIVAVANAVNQVRPPNTFSANQNIQALLNTNIPVGSTRIVPVSSGGFLGDAYLEFTAAHAPIGFLGSRPTKAFAEGGYTGDGVKHEIAGIVHRGEYVVPQNGSLVIRGENERMIAIMEKILDTLRKIEKNSIGTINATINTSAPSVRAGDLRHAIYSSLGGK